MSYNIPESNMLDVYARYRGESNLSGNDFENMTEAEAREIMSEMESLKENARALSMSSTGYLEAIRTGTFYDMWENLNARKNALDHEALAIWNAFESIDPVEPSDLESYYTQYKLIHAKIAAMNELLSGVSADPNEYFQKYDQPEVWNDFLNMFLVEAPEAAATGAKKAGAQLAFGVLPFAAIGLLVFYLFTRIQSGSSKGGE